MYEFSIPMPFYKKFIDYVIYINNNVEKSKIKSLYFALPSNSLSNTGFEQGRFYWKETTNFEDWKPLIVYALEKNFDFIYLLNSPKIYNFNFDDIKIRLEKLDNLINNLKLTGCNKVRVCNPQLMEYLNKNYPDLELYISTSAELKIMKEYSNLFFMFDNIKQFVPAFDLNKNFTFLKNIKRKYPNIKIELMVNEGCLPGCPIRTAHNIFITEKILNNVPDFLFTSNFFLQKCSKFLDNDIFSYISLCNVIYPWEISEYNKIGISNFKFAGRNTKLFETGKYLNYYFSYLKGIDDIKNIKNEKIRFYNNYILTNDYINFSVNEIKKYLPKIKHFKKYGHLCASRCGVECRYCYKCAEKIQNVFEKKQKELIKRTIPFAF